MPYANYKCADHIASPPILISTFVLGCLNSTIPEFAIPKISRLQLASVPEQASLSLIWSQPHKDRFSHGVARIKVSAW